MEAIQNVEAHVGELHISGVIGMKTFLESCNYVWFQNKVDTSKEFSSDSTTHRISVWGKKEYWFPSVEKQREKVFGKVHWYNYEALGF